MPFARTYQRGRRRVVALWVAVLVAGLCSTAAFAFTGATQSVKLAGTWSGSYTGGYAGTFTLHWTQSRSRLTGDDRALEPARDVQHHRQRQRNGNQVRSRRRRRPLFGLGLGIRPVDVRQLDERPGKGHVEGAQAPDPEQGQAPVLTSSAGALRHSGNEKAPFRGFLR